MRTLSFVVALAIVFGARPAAAQEASAPGGGFHLEPRVGVFLDGYDAGATGSRRLSLGLRLADYFMEMEEHSPAFTLGLVFR